MGMRSSRGCCEWWQRPGPRERLGQWVADIAGKRRYHAVFKPGGASYVDFSRRLIVIDPHGASHFCPEAMKLPQEWGGYKLTREGQIHALTAREGAEHEAAHILCTASDHDYHTFDEGRKRLIHGVFNSIEDQRIEVIVSRISQRAAVDFREWAIREWVGGPKMGPDRNLNFMNAMLYHRYAAGYQLGKGAVPIDFGNAEDGKLFWSEIAPLLRQGWAARTSQDALDIAIKIVDLIDFGQKPDLSKAAPGVDGSTQGKRGDVDMPVLFGKAPPKPADPQTAPDPEPQTTDQSEDDEDETAPEADGADEEEDEDNGAPEPEDDRPEGDETPEVGEKEPETEPGSTDGEKRSVGGDDTDDEPDGSGASGGDGDNEEGDAEEDTTGDDDEDELPQSLGVDSDVLDPFLGEADRGAPDPSAHHGLYLWQRDAAPLQDEVRGDVARLVAELKVHDPVAEEEWTNRGGRVNVKALVSTGGRLPLSSMDDEGVSPDPLAIGLDIDISGSMGGTPHLSNDGLSIIDDDGFYNDYFPMPHARRAAMLMLLACGALDVPLAIAASCGSPSMGYHIKNGRGSKWSYGGLPDPVFWVKKLDNPYREEGVTERIAGLYGGGEGAAMSKGMLALAAELRHVGRARRVIVAIHDGQPVDEEPMDVKRTIDKLRMSGHTVIGVFLGPGAGAQEMEKIFGAGWLVNVPDYKQLPKRMGVLLKGLQRG